MLRKLLAVAGLMVVSADAGFAADRSYLTSPISVYDWTGWYLGASAGYGWGAPSNTSAGFDHIASSTIINTDGFVGNVFVAHRRQKQNNVVYGAQLTIPIVGSTGRATGGGSTTTVKTNFALMATGQLGIAHGRWLPMVIGGVGFANATSTVTPAGTTSTATHFLWTLGVGVDYAVNDRFVVGGRYNYVSAAESSHEHPLNAFSTPNQFGLTGHVLSAVATWRLN